MSGDSVLSGVEAASRLLSQAKDNGDGLELHDVFGPAAGDWAVDRVMRPVQEHEGLQWCMNLPTMLEMQRDDSLLPPVWFALTVASEAFLELGCTPAELCAIGTGSHSATVTFSERQRASDPSR